MLTVRPSLPADVPQIMRVIRAARAYMKATGNPTQWGDSRPSSLAIESDIQRGCSYVITDESGTVRGTFALLLGDEPTYRIIRDGCWLNELPYGTIHRVASDGECHGIFAACLAFCSALTPNLRIDTHEKNMTMRHLIEKSGFTRCGIITVNDGSERIAYQRTK